MIVDCVPSGNAVRREAGNALFYVLLGVVLFAALSFIITRQTGNDGLTEQLADDKANIIASQMINHATSVKYAVEQMLANGSTVEQLDFIRPGEAGYDTPPHQHKVFHPSGGGVNVMAVKPEHMSSPTTHWGYQKGRNVEWTPTTQTDLMYSVIDITEPICRSINTKLYGNIAMPAQLTSSYGAVFEYGSTDVDFTAAICADCVGKHTACLKHPSLDRYLFYTVLVGR